MDFTSFSISWVKGELARRLCIDISSIWLIMLLVTMSIS
uniref:Uncharacterized protein n=1 Tax=Rhizophora mucronata TaxID=61149 RepID=A0A2P2NU69_RHIMU